MPIIGKDISLLTQKASVAGTEKLPVSDTQYITPAQIAASATQSLTTSEIDTIWDGAN